MHIQYTVAPESGFPGRDVSITVLCPFEDGTKIYDIIRKAVEEKSADQVHALVDQANFENEETVLAHISNFLMCGCDWTTWQVVPNIRTEEQQSSPGIKVNPGLKIICKSCY